MFETIHKTGLPLFLLGVGFSALVFFFVRPEFLVEGLTATFFTFAAMFGVGFTIMMLITRLSGYPEKIPTDYVLGMGIPTIMLVMALFLSDVTEQTRFVIMAYGPALGTTFYLAAVLFSKSEAGK